MERTLKFGLLLGALLLTACAQPSLKTVEVDPALSARESQLQREMFARDYVSDFMRLNRVAFRIGANATEFCGDAVDWQAGFSAMNAPAISGEMRRPVATAFNLGTIVTVLDVVPGSPAEAAGLRKRDEIVSLAGVPIPESARGMERVVSVLTSNAYDRAGMPMVVRRGGQEVTLTIRPRKACRFPYDLALNQDVNAFTDGESLTFNTGILNFARSDDELALIYGHELSHALLDHIEKQQQNVMAGAAVGLIFDILAAAAGVNTGGDFTRLGAQQGALTYSVDFEAEADYLALYMVARAGYDTRTAPNFWRRMATHNPAGIDYSSTHPSYANRSAALMQVADEIERKEIAGLALVPDLADDAEIPDSMVAALQRPQPPAGGNATTMAAVAPAPVSAPQPIAIGGNDSGTWRAEGASDACGKPYAIALTVNGEQIGGALVRGGAKYDITGTLADASAGKSLGTAAKPGPRRLGLEASLDGNAQASFWIMRGAERECETTLNLRRGS